MEFTSHSNRKIAIVITFISLLSSSFSSAQAATSVTAGLSPSSYSASSTYLGNTAQAAFNGGGWIGGVFGTAWIQAALPNAVSISGIQWLTNQQPNGIATLSLYVSNSAIGNNWNLLTPVATYNQFTVNNTLQSLTFNPVSGSFVQLVANGGPSWTSLSNVTVTAAVAPVPEPSEWLLMLIGLGLLGLIARRNKLQN